MKKVTPIDPMQGAEPTWTKQDPTNEKSHLVMAFNWYGYNCNRKDAKEFVIDYLKKLARSKDEINSIKSLHENNFPVQFGWLSRMISLGFVPSDKTKTYFATTYKNLLSTAKKEKPVVVEDAPTFTVSIQQRIAKRQVLKQARLKDLSMTSLQASARKKLIWKFISSPAIYLQLY